MINLLGSTEWNFDANGEVTQTTHPMNNGTFENGTTAATRNCIYIGENQSVLIFYYEIQLSLLTIR